MHKVLISNFKHKSERAQELAEFALVLPLLLLVLFGVLDLGRAFHASITISNAARVGARFGTNYDWTEGSGYDAIVSAARNEAQGSGIDPDDFQVIPDCGVCDSGDSLTVIVRYPFQFLIGAIMGWSDLILERSAVMVIP